MWIRAMTRATSVREANRGNQIWFVADQEELDDRLAKSRP
jgi:hypothetical protein